MLRATFAAMLHRKLRLVLSGLAVLIGVMFVAGSLVLTDTLSRSFDAVFSDAYGHSDVWVQGDGEEGGALDGEHVPNLPGSVLAEITAVPGVSQATGLVRADGARVVGSDGQVIASFGPPRLGVNWTGERGIVELREGRGPTEDSEVAVNAELARVGEFQVGDEIEILTREPKQTFTLVGIYGFAGGRDSVGGVHEVAFTDGTAQQLMLGEPGVWTLIEVQGDGPAPDILRDEIAAAVGDNFRVRTGEEYASQQADQLQQGLTFFQYILLGFAGIALFVGVFLILNTFSIVIAQRTRELALTRAIGASRRQVVLSVLLEALVIAVLAAAAGIASGIGVGALLAHLAAGFIALPIAEISVSATTIAVPLLVGIVVTLGAALSPALRASRVPPVAALQKVTTSDQPLSRRAIVGGAISAAGAGTLLLGLLGHAGENPLWAVLAGVLVSLIGVTVLTPVVVRPAVSVLGLVFSWSVSGQLGRLNSGRNPRRTAVTASALMVGVALVAGVGVVVSSAKQSITRQSEDTIAADLMIAGEAAGARPASFDAEVIERAAELPGVVAASGLYRDRVTYRGEHLHVDATDDLAVLNDILSLTATEGVLETLGPSDVVVDQDVAEALALSIGSQVTFTLSRGEAEPHRVVGIYEPAPVVGGAILPLASTSQFDVPQPIVGFVSLAEGAAVDDNRREIAALLADSPEVSVVDQSSYIEQQVSQFDFVIVMVQLLLALAILIAVLGIINTLVLSVIERTRELGMLRAIGLTRGSVVRMIIVESVVISLLGAVLGIAVGSGLGAAVVNALQDEGVTELAVPLGELATYLGIAAVVGVLAALLPALRAARTNVLAAVAEQ
ncbi:ABC transporter permease [Natronosporangium hydrolyticum]|uniref:ABC transporter permease n=1 Tax=Natronosporangium hydrolyticum TaxID=2811111 RepID=A0A895YCP4_9ACTN|nr:ABC transporter permease [Natronosporangium hydrolyticum]QSB13985.1 ABC transporter permease [Natronosporangium hydrolyticum]